MPPSKEENFPLASPAKIDMYFLVLRENAVYRLSHQISFVPSRLYIRHNGYIERRMARFTYPLWRINPNARRGSFLV